MKNKLNMFAKIGTLTASFLPFLAAAQAQGNCTQAATAQRILCEISVILNTVIPILITLGVVYFIYGVISYAIAKDDEAKTTGRGAMINGLIALLVIVSIWGLVNIIKNTFGITDNNTINVPCIPIGPQIPPGLPGSVNC